MSGDEPQAAPAPAVLRQEGPHRVTVPAGAHSALSSSSAGVGTKRLRPAVGAVPPAAIDPSLVPPIAEASLGRRASRESSSTEVRRMPGRAPVNGRFMPGGDEPSDALGRHSTSALEARMAELARLNQQTSKVVTALERTMAEDPANSAPTDESPRRRFFKRSSP